MKERLRGERNGPCPTDGLRETRDHYEVAVVPNAGKPARPGWRQRVLVVHAAEPRS